MDTSSVESWDVFEVVGHRRLLNFLHISNDPMPYDPLPHLHYSRPHAAKFTRSGTIEVTGGVSDNGRHIYLAVTDTGVGIPKDKFGQIFGAFKQVW